MNPGRKPWNVARVGIQVMFLLEVVVGFRTFFGYMRDTAFERKLMLSGFQHLNLVSPCCSQIFVGISVQSRSYNQTHTPLLH